MSKKRIIGVQLDPEEIKRSVKIKLDPETVESLFPKNSGKDAYDYIKDFLQSEELYDQIFDSIHDLIHSSLTKEEIISCPCNDLGRKTKIEDNERACATQWAQFQFAYFLSAQDYVQTVLNHHIIYKDKDALKQLTINYFDCFEVLPRKVYFDVDKLSKYALKANFKALSKLFEGSERLKYLKGINETIDVLGEEQVNNELFEKEDQNFVGLQIKFLQNKRNYLNEKIALAEKEGKVLNVDKIMRNSQLRPNRTDLAYFIYYLEHTKTKIIKNVFPSDRAWKEIGEKFDKSPKNIQKVYNLIIIEKERLRKRKDDNLSYVIENMLMDYPKALELAQYELKLALLNW